MAPGFARGDVVTLRSHERLCQVVALAGAEDGFCVPTVLIGSLFDDVRHGWVEAGDLALVVRPSDQSEVSAGVVVREKTETSGLLPRSVSYHERG